MSRTNLGGTLTLPGTSLTIHRMGYGAMQLAGPGVYGPPRDRNEAIAVLREAVDTGINHIDTSDFYGPHVVNEIIREALHPYPEGLVIVTKVGARRDETKAWHEAIARDEIISAVHDNLRNLGLDRLHVVNMRVATPKVNIEEPFTVLAELQQQGLIGHLGVSNVTPAQYEAAKRIAPVVCVQNLFNVAFRDDDAFIQQLAAEGVPYMPYFPLGGFKPLQGEMMADVAAQMNATPMQVALAWLLHHAPNICLIPGTSSRAHLRENIAAASLTLSPEAKAELDAIAAAGQWTPPHR
ncbi:MAG TPA: oxidoreductase [Acidobacteriaceae bacterium]|jgi:aryl-alcohol dehydrogenase-like predicted oxidoreductase